MRFVPRFSTLDVKLGLRMLARYPGITVVSIVAIAVAIGLGAAYFETVDKFLHPRLDVPGGDRVVSLVDWDRRRLDVEPRALHDFATWRTQLESIENLGAANGFVRNLITEDGRVEPVRGAEVTANAFRLMGTRPLLAIMCTNVATLVFARTATRSWEMTVRSALGASRGRIIGQLFSEALVLTAVGTVVGLLLSRVALRLALGQIAANDALPFWLDERLSWKTLLYAGGLTVFGAALVGILPAIRVTRVNIQDMLRSKSAGRSGLRFGGFWTTVIIVQVAITVAFIPLATGGVFQSNRFRERAEAIGAERFLAAHITIDRDDLGLDSATNEARVRNSFDELEHRLSAEPGVEAVAVADRLPVEDRLEYGFGVDTLAGAPRDGLRVSTLVYVSRGYFGAFGASIIAGRDFEPYEFERLGGRVLIVNEAFARNVFGQRNPIGQRVRLLSYDSDETLFGVDKDQWLEIVGVVKNFGFQESQPADQSAMYRPTLPGDGPASNLALRVRDPNAFASRLRVIAAEVDPTIQLTAIQQLGKAGGEQARISWTLTAVAWLVLFLVLMLSATGIHALMSFTVARRTREIGIRVALGARHGQLVAAIFSRAFLQIGAGIVVGSGVAALAGLGSTRQVVLLIAADAIILMVGLAACAVPVRRALRIDPMEALRAE